jgi:hypothetical protein
MTNLILTNGKVENTWFRDFFENKKYKNIGLRLSSGTDSALVLFFLAKFILETESFDIKVFPFLGLNLNNKSYNPEPKAKKIVDIIQKLYSKSKIEDLKVFEYSHLDSSVNKNVYIDIGKNAYTEEKNIELWLTGATLNPPKAIRDLYDINSQKVGFRDDSVQHAKFNNPETAPWLMVNKKFIAHQYYKYNLMENIFPLTESCISQVKPFPCKKCFWCVEKYWAFGMYDNCDTK